MEPNLSKTEALIEDGHVPRDEDLIADDRCELTKLKVEFIRLLEAAAKRCHGSDIEDSFVSCEEHFDDMLHDAWAALAAEDNSDEVLPISNRKAAWLEQSRKKFRPQSTRGSAPANPATLAAKGDDL